MRSCVTKIYENIINIVTERIIPVSWRSPKRTNYQNVVKKGELKHGSFHEKF